MNKLKYVNKKHTLGESKKMENKKIMPTVNLTVNLTENGLKINWVN